MDKNIIYRVEHSLCGYGVFRACWSQYSDELQDILAYHHRIMKDAGYYKEFKINHYCAYPSLTALKRFMPKTILNELINDFQFKVYEIKLDNTGIRKRNQVFFKKSEIETKTDITNSFL